MNCFKPIHIRDPRRPIDWLDVPCGRCEACLANKSSDWVTRLKIEHFFSSSAYFVTLTYADPWLPINRFGNPGFSSRDINLFMKRLRSKVPDKLRYFLTCEYGKEGHRPHYHMCLFNWPLEVDLLTKLAESWVDSKGRMMSLWSNKSVSPLNDERITYVCKYIQKKQDILPGDDKPFMRCSLKPGIGFQLLSPETLRFYRENPTSCIFINGEQRYMPRFIRDRIYNTPELKHAYLLAKERYVNTKLDKQNLHDSRVLGYSSNEFVRVEQCNHYVTFEPYSRLVVDDKTTNGDVNRKYDDLRARIEDFKRKYDVKKRRSYQF